MDHAQIYFLEIPGVLAKNVCTPDFPALRTDTCSTLRAVVKFVLNLTHFTCPKRSTQIFVLIVLI